MKIKSLIIIFILLININVLAVSDTEITNVKVNGEAVTCDNYICNAVVNSTKAKIEYKLVDPEATSSGFNSGDEFELTDNTMTKKLVVSKKLDGFETPISSEYVFNLTKHIKSDDYSLKKVTLNGKSIAIKNDLYVYNVNVKYDVEDLKLEVVPNSTYAEVTIKTELYFDLTDSNKAIDFVVKSEMGTEKEYRIIVIRDDRPDTSIKSIKLSNGIIELERSVYEYEVNVPYDVNEIKIEVEPNDSNATFNIEKEDNLVVGENIVKINVSNKEVSSTYTIKINRLENSDEATVNLKDLKIEDYDLSFKPSVNEYDLYFDEIPNRLKIKATPVNEKNAVIIDNNRNLSDGSVVTVRVSQESLGLTKEYILNIHQNTARKGTSILLFILIPLALIILTAIIIIVKKKKKKNNKVNKKDTKINKEKKEKEEKKKDIIKKEEAKEIVEEIDDDDFEII